MLLDGAGEFADSRSMETNPNHMHLRRLDSSRNMARFYVMQISPNLFGETCLTRTWGRIGKRGQTMVHLFEREEEARQLLIELTNRKRSRGYIPV